MQLPVSHSNRSQKGAVCGAGENGGRNERKKNERQTEGGIPKVSDYSCPFTHFKSLTETQQSLDFTTHVINTDRLSNHFTTVSTTHSLTPHHLHHHHTNFP
ncbi:hypothetical protein NEUTE1DRAFT_116959, partial [Neurospora tetrasperma FGSC 2508]